MEGTVVLSLQFGSFSTSPGVEAAGASARRVLEMFTSWLSQAGDGVLICSIFQFLCCEYFHQGQCQASHVISLSWAGMCPDSY